MYYEFYLDLYFLENLIMNCLVLDMARRVLRYTPSQKRILAAAALGAAGACAVIVTPIHKSLLLTVIYGFLICPVMAAAAFGRKRKQMKWKQIWVTALSSMVLGCLWQLLTGLGIPFAAAVPIGYLLTAGIWQAYKVSAGRVEFLYEVVLQRGEKEVQLTGFLDSGNHLYQPGSRKPVHIVDYNQIRSLLTEQECCELDQLLHFGRVEAPSGIFSYIPYRSIGDKTGMLPAVKLDAVRIKHGESVGSTKGILAAVSKEAVSSRGEYQMILHPQILK